MVSDNSASGTISLGSWTITGYGPRRSSSCPHCTPKCPHGFPADDYGMQPYWYWPNQIMCEGGLLGTYTVSGEMSGGSTEAQ